MGVLCVGLYDLGMYTVNVRVTPSCLMVQLFDPLIADRALQLPVGGGSGGNSTVGSGVTEWSGCLGVSGSVGSGPASLTVGSGPVGSGPVGSGPVGSGPVGSGPIVFSLGGVVRSCGVMMRSFVVDDSDGRVYSKEAS